MKKLLNKTSQQPRKLVLHREAIALLTFPQLSHAVGGEAGSGSVCRTQSANTDCTTK
jgi:hypothetical protein